MPEFQTTPAEEGALLQKPKASFRRVIVAAAALSFVLGAVAARTTTGKTSIGTPLPSRSRATTVTAKSSV